LENVPGLLTDEYFGRILGDLAECGYDARWKVLSAAELGAPHLRDRLWIVVADAAEVRWQEREWEKSEGRDLRHWIQGGENPWITATDDNKVPSELIRMADGLADRVYRLEAAGDGQVPAVVAKAWEILSF
jgi:DNA (cytosine-5)-methyltransferase 1